MTTEDRQAALDAVLAKVIEMETKFNEFANTLTIELTNLQNKLEDGIRRQTKALNLAEATILERFEDTKADMIEVAALTPLTPKEEAEWEVFVAEDEE